MNEKVSSSQQWCLLASGGQEHHISNYEVLDLCSLFVLCSLFFVLWILKYSWATNHISNYAVLDLCSFFVLCSLLVICSLFSGY